MTEEKIRPLFGPRHPGTKQDPDYSAILTSEPFAWVKRVVREHHEVLSCVYVTPDRVVASDGFRLRSCELRRYSGTSRILLRPDGRVVDNVYPDTTRLWNSEGAVGFSMSAPRLRRHVNRLIDALASEGIAEWNAQDGYDQFDGVPSGMVTLFAESPALVVHVASKSTKMSRYVEDGKLTTRRAVVFSPKTLMTNASGEFRRSFNAHFLRDALFGVEDVMVPIQIGAAPGTPLRIAVAPDRFEILMPMTEEPE